MAGMTGEEAIASARSGLGLDPRAGARAWHVRRLDRDGAAYYLVVFGEEDAAVAVATVDAAAGRVESSARLPGGGPHLVVGRARALELAGLGAASRAELVWRPCRASYSPLYPLWEVTGAGGARRFVDQQGGVWPSPGEAGPGGA